MGWVNKQANIAQEEQEIQTLKKDIFKCKFLNELGITETVVDLIYAIKNVLLNVKVLEPVELNYNCENYKEKQIVSQRKSLCVTSCCSIIMLTKFPLTKDGNWANCALVTSQADIGAWTDVLISLLFPNAK